MPFIVATYVYASSQGQRTHSARTKMKTLNEQVKELTENQKLILEAIKYLNERLEINLEKVNDDQIKDVNNIIESQAMMDQLVVKNSDDIIAIRKRKDENQLAIKTLEAKI